jgi:hypothetical protein
MTDVRPINIIMLYKNIYNRLKYQEMNVLTPDEIAFLAKKDRQRKKHTKAQALYPTKHQEEIKDYNKKYYEVERTKLNEIKQK